MKKTTLIVIIILTIIVNILSGCNDQTDDKEAPIINYFTVTPPTVILGQYTSVLNWSVKGAKIVSIDNGIGNVPLNGSYRVLPTKYMHHYNLTAYNDYGTNISSVIVLVNGAFPNRTLKTISAINTAINKTGNYAVYKVIRTDDDILWANLSIKWEDGGGLFGINLSAITNGTTIAVGNSFIIFFGADGTYSPDLIYDKAIRDEEGIIWVGQTITV